MKKNTLQKMLSVALVGAMTATMFAGCGSSSEDTSADTTADTTTEEATEDVVAGMDGWTAFADNVEIQIPVYDRGDSSNGVSDVVDNYWTKWVQENFGDKYNITVTYVPITRSDVMTDYSLLASTGDLPTICMEYDYDKLATWASDGYLQTYDVEQLKTVAPTYYQQMVDNGLDAYTNLTVDGDSESYLVLGARDYGFSNYTYATWYRLDWVKEAGYDTLPTNTTELLECYAKIAEKHPQFLSGSKVSGAGVDQNYGYRDYPQDELTWATTGDYQIPALSTEAQKRYLKLQNYLYNQGYINPEYQTRDSSEATADFVNGTALYYSAYVSANMDDLTAFYENNPDAELAVCVTDSTWSQDSTWGTSNSYRAGSPIGAMFGFSNNATEDQIKAVEMYIEWMIQDENLFTMQWGIEGVNFEYDENGTPVMLETQPDAENGQMGHNTNVDYWMIVQAVKTVGTIEDTIAAIAPVGLPQDFTEDLINNFYGQKALYEAGYANVDCMFGASLDSVDEYGTTLKEETYPRLRDELVTCDPDEFDDLYEQASEEYLAAGYQAVIDERAELYNEGLTTTLN